MRDSDGDDTAAATVAFERLSSRCVYAPRRCCGHGHDITVSFRPQLSPLPSHLSEDNTFADPPGSPRASNTSHHRQSINHTHPHTLLQAGHTTAAPGTLGRLSSTWVFTSTKYPETVGLTPGPVLKPLGYTHETGLFAQATRKPVLASARLNPRDGLSTIDDVSRCLLESSPHIRRKRHQRRGAPQSIQ